jgi:hypothetical protein
MPAPRKREGTRVDERPQRAPVVPVAGRVVAPPAATSWLKTTKQEWEALFSSDLGRTVDGTSLPGLMRLFEMRDLQRRAWIRYKRRPYVDGSQGQPVANPAFGEAMTLERAIVALEDRYGVSLKAMANLGVAVGQAKLTAAELNRMTMGGNDDNANEVLEVQGWEAG